MVAKNIGESEGSDVVGSNGLNFVGLAPVDIGAAHDTSSVKDGDGLELGYVGFEGGSILKAVWAVLGPVEGVEEVANPACATIDIC